MKLRNQNLLFTYRSYAFVLLALSAVCIVVDPLKAVTWINSLHSFFLDNFFGVVTNLGSGIILIPFIVLLSFKRIYLSIALVANALAQGIVVTILKRGLFPHADRPMAFLEATSVHLVQGIDVHKHMSFPSGHSVTIFGLCIFLALCYRNNFVSIVSLFLGVLVGISRVYLLQHFLTDVAAGAIIGTISGIVIFYLFQRLEKPQWMSHRMEIKVKISEHNPRLS